MNDSGTPETGKTPATNGDRPADGAGQEPTEQDASPVEDPVCAICGQPIEQDTLVCPNCGTKMVSG